ncbi:MAG: ferredoxin [Methanoregula sp.]|nr:ferredoxin [Methanoregula sp.]
MKVTIDRKNCVSCGNCWETCPLLFEQNPDDSLSQIREKFRLDGNIAEGTPAPEMENCTRDVVDLCPAQIISVE